MALLHALHELRGEWGLKFTVGHLDHGIRVDAKEGLAVVREAAETLGLPLVYGKRDAPALARDRKMNLEEAARLVRREFLEGAAEEAGAGKSALGHTRTDLAETVLLHLLRGAGPTRLKGFLPYSPLRAATHPLRAGWDQPLFGEPGSRSARLAVPPWPRATLD